MAATPLNFLAHFRARPGQEAAVHDALAAMLGPTRAERGNVNYDLHQRNDDPAVFVLYEGWQSQAALDGHMQTLHFRGLIDALRGKVVVPHDGTEDKPFSAEALTMVGDLALPKLADVATPAASAA